MPGLTNTHNAPSSQSPRLALVIRVCTSLAIVYGIISCGVTPGSVNKLKGHKLQIVDSDTVVMANGEANGSVKVAYLGSGGVLVIRNGAAVLVDPFFSNQRFGRIGRSLFLAGGNARTMKSDPKMISHGVETIRRLLGDSVELKGLLVSHSHYDHLMDVPAVLSKLDSSFPVFLNETGFNICHRVMDTSRVAILETQMTKTDVIRHPFVVPLDDGSTIQVRPILADHNPHFRHVKFFSGSQKKPVHEFADPFQKSAANLWLEGNTFSFLIDFVRPDGTIDYRVFIQSSSCDPPAGIPPAELLSRPVDLALLGVVSYQYSPEYPCAQLNLLAPSEIIWLHWEDFFRKYDRKPKTVRGTDIPGFFNLPCVKDYPVTGRVMWPGTTIRFIY